MPPKVLPRHDRASGVLPVNAAAARAASNPTNKQPAARLKLEVRRLPPGLTVEEFEETLGELWTLGKGKVDWREYRRGKLRAPGKLPEQSRCYLHLVNEASVKDFEQRFLAVVFHDKAGTYKNQELKNLPPTLGYAPNQRIPLANKQKIDNRQGTIDQDPEFIAFLEAETQPIPKATALDAVGLSKDEAKVEVKSTPLLDDLREKKANKAKAAASKAERKAASRAEQKEQQPTTSKATAKSTTTAEVKKAEQVVQEVKVGKQQAAIKQTQAAAQSPSIQQKTTTPAKKKREKPPSAQLSPKPAVDVPATPAASTQSPAGPQKMSAVQRAKRDTEGIKKMLQKDLGIKPKNANVPTSSAKSKAGVSSTTSNTSTTPQTNVQPQPTSAKQAPNETAKTPVVQTSTSGSAPSPAPTLKAFLKHANPSQGMTEELIKQALSQYGDINSVNIDSRKGTAIAAFASEQALQKAIQARKVSVANGAIEVLEFRDRSSATGPSQRGGPGRGSGRGGRGRNAPGTAASTPVKDVPAG